MMLHGNGAIRLSLAHLCRWGGDDEQQIKALGHDVHLLEKSGHWVHTDNPKGLLEIMWVFVWR